jgi:thiamine kinase-like enzyme
MWRIIEFLLVGTFIILLCTEILYPLVSNTPYFPSFRKSKPKPKVVSDSIESKLENAKSKVNEVKEVQEEVKKEFQKAKNLKNKADNLLK